MAWGSEMRATVRLSERSPTVIARLAGVFALAVLLASCGIPDPVTESTTLKAISQAGTGVILFSLVPVQPNGVEGGCVQGLAVTLTKQGLDGNAKKIRVDFGVGYFGLPHPHRELVLEPGDYELAELRCLIMVAHNHTVDLTIRGPADRSFGKFSIGAGEVVDIGKLYNIGVADDLRFNRGTDYFLEARPNPPEIIAKFKEEHPDLAAVLQTRLITTWAPLSNERKRQLCEAQKAHLAKGLYLTGPPESTICKLLIASGPRERFARTNNGTIQ